MHLINPRLTDPVHIRELSSTFRNAPSFPHICIDDFLESDFAENLHNSFPPISQMHKHYKGLNERKSEESDFSKLDPTFLKLRKFLSGTDFTSWLEKICGYPSLTVPPDFRGAGIYQGGNGSFLDIHIDFSVHPTLRLQRKVNVLLFFNKNWEANWGGHLELWNPSVTQCLASFAPLFNRCVIFECNEVSYHGYDKIVTPDNVFRKSFYMYFYTPLNEHVKYHDTVFKLKPSVSNFKKIQTALKESLKTAVKSGMKRFGMQKLLDRLEK